MKTKNKHRGVALILAMVFVVIFSAISIGFLSLSSANTQLADNHRTANNALNAAFSGLELMQYWCSRPDIAIPGLTPQNQRYTEFIIDLQSVLNDDGIAWTYDADTGILSVGSSDEPIMIDATIGSRFYIEAAPAGSSINISIIGQSKQLTRKLNVQFTYGVRPYSVFDYGVATKGPLQLKGTLTGATVKSESDVYIEYYGTETALELLINKSEIAGLAKIANPCADIDAWDIRGKVGGLSGQDAIDQTIEIGAAPTEFPYPNASHFLQYATGGYYTGGSTLENVVIKAGTNPKFTGNTTINGILYIESPNVVDFGGNVTVNGMIVAEGDWQDNSATNKLEFTGSVDSRPFPEDTRFNNLRQEKGTFLIAPGFDLKFWGSFGIVNGAISGNGVRFGGNAGGTVNGSIINYSSTTMTVEGSSDIIFNRSGITEIPAGFIQIIVIHYNPESYQENR